MTRPRQRVIAATVDLSADDLTLIRESLNFTELAYREYRHYPSEDFRNQQIDRVQQLQRRLTAAKSAHPLPASEPGGPQPQVKGSR